MKTEETFGGQKGLLKQEDYSFKTASVVDQICNRFNGLSGDIITLYDAAKFAEEFAAQSVREDRESRWISVKTPPELSEQVFWYNDENERVPWEGKFQRHVLAIDSDGRIFMARLDCNGWAEVSKNSISGLVNPILWQPLPGPPTNKG